jgi:hypothetical protein
MNVSWNEIPVNIRKVLVYKETALPLKRPTSRSFMEALAPATYRTVSKEERSTILSTLYAVVDEMNEIDLCRAVCR